MIRVPLVDEAVASGRLEELYAAVKEAMGIDFVPDMFRLLSSRPDFLEAVLAGYKSMFLTDVLERQTSELVAAWTSRLNQCPYCVGTHNFFVAVHGGSDELVHAIETADTVDELPVSPEVRELMRLADKVSRSAWAVTDADWDRARSFGWSDDALLHAVFTASLFNAITRLVDSCGLGSSVDQSKVSSLRDST